MITLRPLRPATVVALGAHGDDIAIGAGATLLSICSANPGLAGRHPAAVWWQDRSEVRSARADRFRIGTRPRRQSKICVRRPARHALAPKRFDAHQGHRPKVAELVPTAFRGDLVLSCEIVRWDGNLGAAKRSELSGPTLLEARIDLLWKTDWAQRHRPLYDREAFLGLARKRCRMRR